MSDQQQMTLPDKKEIKTELGLVDPAEISVDKETDTKLDKEAAGFVDKLLDFSKDDVNARESSKAAVEVLGENVQKEAARRSQMLQGPIKELQKRGEDGGDVANALIDLKIKVEELDPSKIDFGKPGWFSRMVGKVPVIGKALKKYFSKFEKSQTVLDAIINALKNGKVQLDRDNGMLVEDQKALRESTLKLEKVIKLGQLIDTKLQYKAAREYADDEDKKRFIEEELLFPLRQRIMDLQQQLVVSQQGVIAIELIIRNNKELIRGVNRAINVTVNALQVAVTVALALTHQRIVLKKIEAVNKTTSDLIAGTAATLRQQGAAIHKQASSSMLDIEALKSAFRDINIAMEDIARYRKEALPRMAETILEFEELSLKGEKSIQKLEKGNRINPTVTLNID
jgi:uncharacterized protein YaaN involved in tellurite resistance